MKKILIFSLLLALSASFVMADSINLGNFPLGKYLDDNYDAVWEFTTGNIRILSPAGAVLYDFNGKTIRDFKVGLEGSNPMITFSCDESERSYKFVKPLTKPDLEMSIQAPWDSDYSVTLIKQ
ncbi:MAG: hypothetical protein D6B26_02045 [Spirochaetaceae bacterium]|nr:MAG: hypothetical protein D6B26_02045 [Spirochaetaceae bacterium]